MAKRQVEYVIKADSKQAFNASRRLLQNAQAYGDKLESAGNKGARGFSKTNEQLTRMKQFLMGAGGVLAAWKLINSELERHKNLQADSAETMRQVTDAQQGLLRNLPGVKKAEAAELFKEIDEMAQETSVNRSYLTEALGQAVSASGGNIAAAKSAVRGAAMFVPEKPGLIPKMAGAFLDIQKSTGTMDAMTNLGVLQHIGAQSRIVDPALQLRNIAPALVGMTGAGATTEGAGELFAWLTGQSGDQTGERSRTASVNFAVKAREFFKEQGISGVDTMAGRIAYMQQRPKLAGKFLEGLGGEVQFKPIWEQLFAKGSLGQEAYLQVKDKIPGIAGMADAGREALEKRAYAPGEFIYKTERGFKVAREGLAMNPREAIAAVVRQQLKGDGEKPGLIDRLSGTGIGAKFQEMMFEAHTLGGTRDVIQPAISLVKERQRDILKQTRIDAYEERTGRDFPIGGRMLPHEFKEYAATPLDSSRISPQDQSVLESLNQIYRVLFDARKELTAINAKTTQGRESFDRVENE